MGRAILKPIIPKGKLYETDAIQRELKQALHNTGMAMKRDFEATTATWETDVKFTMRSKVDGSQATVTVSTGSDIYNYVSGGTKPHVIRPKRARILHFRTGYRAKTSLRGSTIAHGGGATGPFVWARKVQHPGTKARHFERRIVVKYQDVLPSVIQAAIIKAVEKG